MPYSLFFRTASLLLLQRTRSCAQCPIREEQLQNRGKLIQAADADLGWAKRHACAIALIKHPVRKFAAMARPLFSKNTLQILAAPERRYLHRSPE
jgi:hypothetical protein